MSRQQRLVLIVSILASFIAFLDGSIINVALPAISKELGGGLALQQWVVNAYLITLGSLILIAGSLSDVIGRKNILGIGLIGFAVTSVLCAIAPSGEFLIISRALQGVAGALLVPSSLAMIISAFSGTAQAKAIGTWTAWTGAAFIVGPLLGGAMVDLSSWRLVFGINILPVAVTLGLMRYMSSDGRRQPGARIDYVGAILCTVGLAGSVYALIEQSRYGWANPLIFVPACIGLLALVLFVWYEKRASHPMLPLKLFRVRNFSVGNLATVAIYAGLSVAVFLITIFIQQVGGYSALQSGLALVPVTILMFLLSSFFGALAGKYGPRLFMSLGPLVIGLGFCSMLLVGESVHYLTQLLPGVLMLGLGLSITVAPLTAAVLGAVSKENAGIASAVNNAVARVAGLVAVAVLGLITGPQLSLSGFHRGVGAMAGLMFLGAAISAIGINNPKKPTEKQQFKKSPV